MVIKNFADAHRALRPLYDNARTKYDLAIMQRLMDYLGNPQDRLRIAHVAGTSGKTSTAYYIAALLQSAGKSVGLTVSPHVDEVNERVQIDLQPLPEAEFCNELTEFLELVAKSRLRPSYFEVMVAFAYWEFARRQVDYAVVEVGLGGLLDGTNVVTRKDKVCVITDIGLDHTEMLGDTIEKIAVQKAGIIHTGNEVFMYDQSPGVNVVVQKTVHDEAANLHIIPPLAAIADSSLPLFQQRNLGLAVQVVNFIVQRDGISALSNEQLQLAAQTKIPARMEKFHVNGKVLILDGSHNAQKLGTLVESIKAAHPGERITALIAFVQGPDNRWQGGLDQMIGFVDELIITSFTAEQDVPKASIEPERLATYCRRRGFHALTVEPDAKGAFTKLLKSEKHLLLVAGSFYLLNSIRPLIVR